MLNYTENYWLPQWEETDRVLREDFNDAMYKIDAAVHDLPYVKIAAIKTDTAATTIRMDVSEIDFMQYLRVDLFFITSKQISGNVELGLNGKTNNHCLQGSGIGGVSSGGNLSRSLGTFEVFGYPNGWVSFFAPMSEAQVGCAFFSCAASTYGGAWRTSVATSKEVTWGTLTSFDFLCGSNIPAGTEAILCGIRK